MAFPGAFSSVGDRTAVATGVGLDHTSHNPNFGAPNDIELLDLDRDERGNQTPGDVDSVYDTTEQMHERVTHLARQYSRVSQKSGRSKNDKYYPSTDKLLQSTDKLGTSTDKLGLSQNDASSPALNDVFAIEEDTELDPFSPHFNVESWLKHVLSFTSRDPERYPRRTAGFASKGLSVFGYGKDTDFQQTVGNVFLSAKELFKGMTGNKGSRVDILNNVDMLVEAGEMLVVLGPPGSGCSTLLKTIAGETHGIYVDPTSEINYQGISAKQMRKNFRGEAIYTAEQDIHFPQLTVGDTLAFAAEARSSRQPYPGITRKQLAAHTRDVVMSVLGISHTVDTKVGNEFIRGVSGGERKRVSIAEAMLSMAPLQCWDNSTRGLDSANAVSFCKNLRLSTRYSGATACVAIYQSPQSAFDCFDKVSVLYEGYQIYFGKTTSAKQFFIDMGFACPEQQSTPDFLTSLTSPAERRVRPGFERSVPQTPIEFDRRWRESETYAQLMRDIDANTAKYPFGGEHLEKFKASRRAQQSKHARDSSPYTLSFPQQTALCLRRGWWRLRADPTVTAFQIFFNGILALIVSSAFFNLKHDTSSFFSRGGLIFFACLLNAFGSSLEILTLYAQRPIVEKQERYAMIRPAAEAAASMLCDLPAKFANAWVFNIVVYFMTNLRRTGEAFMFFWFVSFLSVLAMSMFFRTIASVSRSLVQAMAPAAVLIVGLILYTGFALPVPFMLSWISWFRYCNPIYFSFEALMVNEFAGQDYVCDSGSFIPTGPQYANLASDQYSCNVVGAVAGQPDVSGAAYVRLAYGYLPEHKWRNVGIIVIFIFGLMGVYLTASEVIKAQKSKGEVIIYPRTKIPKRSKEDLESQRAAVTRSKTAMNREINMQKQTAVFHWQDLCYDIKIKKEERRILDHVDGWVKPGTLTALMGVSGAGKTTLLDCLATRTTMGVITGDVFVDGRARDSSFQRKTGYCQQQDVHLATSTVREALEFSALLRQPRNIPRAEKLAYVDEVLDILEMTSYQHAVVGNLGEGLNVEQRKRLTIGVELAAKPQLLLFLDEPTSGLDSQTSWSILDLLTKLKDNGQAILCTIHQPSAMLFERFDRLLFLAKGGKTVYFGEVGKGSSILIDYFEKNGGLPYPAGANPAEWMLDVIGASPGSHSDVDWPVVWTNSPEKQSVKQELATLLRERPALAVKSDTQADPAAYEEFAATTLDQYFACQRRIFQQIWRTPAYIYSKLLLVVTVGLFIGFSLYKADTSIQGLQNQLFGVFLLMNVFSQLVQQIQPAFVVSRSLYEVRERPAKTYSWKVFMLTNILVEFPWNTFAGIALFFCWYFPIGLYRNAEAAGDTVARGGQMLMFMLGFLWFASTFSHLMIAALPTAEAASNLGNLFFSLALIFSGALIRKTELGWWIWLYYISPFTYIIEGMLSTAISGNRVVCAEREYLQFNPRAGETCQAYLQDWLDTAGGYVQFPDATSDCRLCVIAETDVFLTAFSMSHKNAWRDFGIMMVFAVFNIGGALGMYYLFRVPKAPKQKKEASNENTPRESSSIGDGDHAREK